MKSMNWKIGFKMAIEQRKCRSGTFERFLTKAFLLGEMI